MAKPPEPVKPMDPVYITRVLTAIDGNLQKKATYNDAIKTYNDEWKAAAKKLGDSLDAL